MFRPTNDLHQQKITKNTKVHNITEKIVLFGSVKTAHVQCTYIHVYIIAKWVSRSAIKHYSDDSFDSNQVISIQQLTINY